MRGPRSVAWVAIAACLAGCRSDGVQPEDPESIESWMIAHDVPGVSVAVIRDFQVAYLESYGVRSRATGEPVTDETLFQVASLSKGGTAAAVMTLVQDGTLSLDVDVSQYLTSWVLPREVPGSETGVTLRRLLSHTAGTTVSGFRGYRYSEPWPTLLQILDGESPANSAPVVVDLLPGRQWRYSGGGYEVVELALRDVTGVDFPDLMRDRILDPMGMTASTYRQPLPDSLLPKAASGYYADGVAVPGRHHVYIEMGAGGLWSTAEDMARYLISIQRALDGATGGPLTPSSAQALVTTVMSDYGLGFGRPTMRGEPYFGHQGANDGFRSGMIAHLTSGDGVVLLTNSDRGSDLWPDVRELIAKRERWPGW